MNKSIMMIKSFFLLAVLLIGVSPLVSASFHDERPPNDAIMPSDDAVNAACHLTG